MTDNVVELRPKLECEDIVQALRNIADGIESGEYGWVPTIGVLVLGGEEEHRDRDGINISSAWQTHGIGTGTTFSFRGLLATALADL